MRKIILLLLFVILGILKIDAQTAFSDLAKSYSAEGNYEKAIRLEKQGLEMVSSVEGINGIGYSISLRNIARYYYLSGNTHESINFLNCAISELYSIKEYDITAYCDVFQDLGGYYFIIKEYGESIKNTKVALKITESFFGEDSKESASLLDNIALSYYYLKDYKNAIFYGKKAFNIISNSSIYNSKEIVSFLTNFALYLQGDKKLSEAVKIIRDALEYASFYLPLDDKNYFRTILIAINLYGESNNASELKNLNQLLLKSIENKTNNISIISTDLIEDLRNVALINYENGNYYDAIIFRKLINEYYSLTEQTNCLEYANSLNDISLCYLNIHDFEKALKTCSQALEIRRLLLGLNNIHVVESLDNLATIYNGIGNINMADMIIKEISNYEYNIDKENIIAYVGILHNQARNYSIVGNFSQAVKLEQKAIELCKNNSYINHSYYLICLNGLLSLYGNLGLYSEAFNIGEEIFQIFKKEDFHIKGKDVYLLTNVANLYHNLHNYERSVEISSKIADIVASQWGKDHYFYLAPISILASSYTQVGKEEKAVSLVEQLNEAQKTNGIISKNYFEALEIGAKVNYNSGRFDKAFQLQKEAIDIIMELYGKDNAIYMDSYCQLIRYLSHRWIFNNIGEEELSTFLSDEFIDLYKKIMGENTLDYRFLLRIKLLLKYNTGDKINFNSYIQNCNNIIKSNLFNKFSFLTSHERTLVWDNDCGWFDVDLRLYSFETDNEFIQKEAYNAILISKGILLNSEIEFDKFLGETGDEVLLKQYNEIKSLRLQLNKLYEKPIAERYVDTDSLERQANELERQLMQESAEFGDYTRNLSITWQDVQKGLKKKDIAIEYVSFPLNNDSTMYMAYVLKPDMESPKMVKLFEEKDITSLYPPTKPENIYHKDEATDLIWRKLQPYLEGCEEVYFAPDGILHQIAIEYLPNFEGEGTMADKFRMHRLSSTRQIALNHDKNNSVFAAVYGGIVYDNDVASMETESSKYPKEEDFLAHRGFNPFVNYTDILNTRDGVRYLEGTKVEAEEVNMSLNRNNYQTRLVTGKEATEESFKDLSGKDNGIIHIATHGFYWKEDEADRMARSNERLMFMSQLNDNGPRYVEDKALTRSGLFMAGANNILSGDTIPEGVDDGILTAQEIAQMNLRGTDLVVLSACQTGMGEISGDGVLGLQRGFKKAGVNSLLMSLWDVDDTATQMLMTSFYENLMSGQSKQQSLLNAQKTVREFSGEINGIYRDFSNPRYWAAFILLDALN